MAVDARRSAMAGDGRSIRSVLFRTMAESRDVSYLGLLARHRIITETLLLSKLVSRINY